VLDVGADDRGGIFGPQGERSIVAVGEGVHLLGDDVGLLADTAGEQLRFLQNRRADFLIAIGVKNGARRGLHLIPDFGRWGQ